MDCLGRVEYSWHYIVEETNNISWNVPHYLLRVFYISQAILGLPAPAASSSNMNYISNKERRHMSYGNPSWCYGHHCSFGKSSSTGWTYSRVTLIWHDVMKIHHCLPKLRNKNLDRTFTFPVTSFITMSGPFMSPTCHIFIFYLTGIFF